MKYIKVSVLMVVLFSSVLAIAQQGILPGEPDPNFGPGKDSIYKNVDRKPCPHGQKRFQVYHCAPEHEVAQDCKNYHAVFECSTKPKIVTCKKPLILKPLYRCEGE